MSENDGGISYEEYRSQCFALEQKEEIREKLLKFCGRDVTVHKSARNFSMTLKGELSYLGRGAFRCEFVSDITCGFMLEEVSEIRDNHIYLRS